MVECFVGANKMSSSDNYKFLRFPDYFSIYLKTEHWTFNIHKRGNHMDEQGIDRGF